MDERHYSLGPLQTLLCWWFCNSIFDLIVCVDVDLFNNNSLVPKGVGRAPERQFST